MKKWIVLLFFCAGLFAKDLQIYIVHGYGSTSDYGWLPSIAQELQEDKNSVWVPNLPKPFEPKLQEWLLSMQENFTKLDNKTYFITHSLGGVALLDFLSTQDENTRIGGVIMVSPFDEPLKILPVLDDFVEAKRDYKKLQKMIKHIVIISAKDDSVVPTTMSERLAKKLNAKFIQTQSGGHFMESEGFKKMPLVVQEFKKIEND
ncbi:esterase [Helicobacter valdiviensis]|uniref:Esterase n=1 Tax=Helicobacter valdiviensis TaxID=1458358 RepID=A0A2W6NMW3_9HELI|nr:alpha/beta hydrolase [Helicobacter valdiviensis]PZT48786.1 esterase [Helicobacter valdiviensis]